VKKKPIIWENNLNQYFPLQDCTSWQHKYQPLHLYGANQHGLPLETDNENLLLVSPGVREPVLKKFESQHWK